MRGYNGLTDGHIFYRDLRKEYMMIDHAEGIYLYDSRGDRIIDGASGAAVVCLGHGDRRVMERLTEQARKVSFTHMSTFTNEPMLRLSAELVKLAPRRLSRVYFASGGSEAVETSLKLARQYHIEKGNSQKYKVISRTVSYHGATIGALSMTGHYPRRRKYLPLLTQFPKISTPYCWRCPYGKTSKNCSFECAHELERAILSEDPENVLAFIAEPIIGASAPAVAYREKRLSAGFHGRSRISKKPACLPSEVTYADLPSRLKQMVSRWRSRGVFSGRGSGKVSGVRPKTAGQP